MSLPLKLNPHQFQPKLYAKIPENQKQRVLLWLDLFEQILDDEHPSKRMKQVAGTMANMSGFSVQTFRRYYDAIKAGADWTVFTHGCAVDKKQKKRKGLPEAFIQYFQQQCLENQRQKVQPVRRKLIRDWRSGKSIPGYGTWQEWWQREKDTPPPTDPGFEVPLPVGWSYPRLNAHRPDEATWDLAAIGPKKFSQHLPGIRKTRKDLKVGQVTMWDDMWLNSQCYFGKEIVRVLGLLGTDVASTFCHTFGMQPRATDEATGKKVHLKEFDMRCLVAAQVQGVGFHKDGNVQMVERGTATIRDEQAKALSDCSGGLIQVSLASQVGGAFYDQFHGAFGGKTKHKALIEVLHAYIQNEAACLPGQTGKNPADAPEQMAGLNEYALTLLYTAMMLPEQYADAIRYPLPQWGPFCDAMYRVMDNVANRTEHNIEGWEANKWVSTEYRLGERSNWAGSEIFEGLTPEEYAAVRAVVCKPGNSRPVKLSPRQVWKRGQNELATLGPWHSPALLGEQALKEVMVKNNHTFEFKNREVDAEPLVFPAYLTDLNNNYHRLPAGEVYGLYFNPFLPQWAAVANAKGEVLGTVSRQEFVGHTDHAAWENANKEAAKQFAATALPYKQLAAEKIKGQAQDFIHHTKVIEAAKAEGKAMLERTPADEDRAVSVLEGLGVSTGEELTD